MWYDSIILPHDYNDHSGVPDTISLLHYPTDEKYGKASQDCGCLLQVSPFTSTIQLYIMLSTYMISASFVSFLFIISVFVIRNIILNSWASIFFPRKVVWARPIVPTDYDNPKYFLPKRTKLAPGRQLLRLGLQAAIEMADLITNVYLLQEKYFNKDIQSYHENHGFLMTGNFNSDSIKKLRLVLEASNIHLLKSDDYFELIVYTGFSKVFTPNIIYFVSEYLTNLDKPMAMDGITGLLVATQKGQVWYEVINDAGGLYILECEGYFLLDIKVRLFTPQVFIQELQEWSGKYTLTWDRSVLIKKNGDRISIGYHCQTALPVLQKLYDATNTAKSLACVTDNNKNNLSSHENNLFS